MIDRSEIDRRLDFVEKKRGEVIRELNDRGIRCQASQLSRALDGEMLDCFARIRAAADEITMRWVKEKKEALEKQVAAELAPYGVKGRVTVGIPGKMEVPVYVDGEIFGIYSTVTHRIQ